MALTKGLNSYVTVSEANAYFSDRLDTADWVAASDATKGQALVTATGILDDQTWTGTAYDTEQPLAFPRQGTYYDPKIGTYLYLDDSAVPERILKATMELAFHLILNDGLLDDTGTVKSIDVSSIKLDLIKAPSLISPKVKALINPLLLNGGSTSWWRAN